MYAHYCRRRNHGESMNTCSQFSNGRCLAINSEVRDLRVCFHCHHRARTNPEWPGAQPPVPVVTPRGDHVRDATELVDRAPCDSCGGGPDVAAIGTDPAAAEAFLRGEA